MQKFLVFLTSVRCLIVTQRRCTKATLSRRILTDELDPAYALHRHCQCCSCLICVVAVQLSQMFGCLPSQSSSAGEGQMSSHRYTAHPCALPLSPPFSLSLSLRWSLSALLHYTLINISEALSHIHHWIRPH